MPPPKRSACSYRRRKQRDRSRHRRRRAVLGSPASVLLPSWSPARTPQPPAARCPPLQPCKLAHTQRPFLPSSSALCSQAPVSRSRAGRWPCIIYTPPTADLLGGAGRRNENS
ncbi:hypothetical protein SETIT_9G256300v2 [Setaria italica]|uniref:Uncharacterized protein n=1 Tax=Setaria italica TaxID=4555 RepID=A0A368SKR4_SETIT|nr:hypothetical protein SETIT_9G256300v2 [Setaria italica]